MWGYLEKVGFLNVHLPAYLQLQQRNLSALIQKPVPARVLPPDLDLVRRLKFLPARDLLTVDRLPNKLRLDVVGDLPGTTSSLGRRWRRELVVPVDRVLVVVPSRRVRWVQRERVPNSRKRHGKPRAVATT